MGQGTMRVAGQTAGWFADPAGRFRFRYWDGGQWTDQVLSSTREEGIDPLEPALRVEPPRPVLPTAPVETNLGGAPLVDPQAAAGRSRDRTVRIPRPSPSFIAAMLLVALTAG